MKNSTELYQVLEFKPKQHWEATETFKWVKDIIRSGLWKALAACMWTKSKQGSD